MRFGEKKCAKSFGRGEEIEGIERGNSFEEIEGIEDVGRGI